MNYLRAALIAALVLVGVGSSHQRSSAMTIETSTVTLSDNQIKTLPTQGVTLVTAPGANKVIEVVKVVLIANFDGGGYGDLDPNGELRVEYSGPDLPAVQSVFAGQGEDVYTEFFGNGGYLSLLPTIETSSGYGGLNFLPLPITGSSSIANRDLTIRASNGGSDFTGGDSANTLKVTVLYAILDL